MKRLFRIFILVLLFSMTFNRNAQAYIDPGTGSYIFQILAAFFIGIGFVVKSSWRHIIAFFSNLYPRKRK